MCVYVYTYRSSSCSGVAESAVNMSAGQSSEADTSYDIIGNFWASVCLYRMC